MSGGVSSPVTRVPHVLVVWIQAVREVLVVWIQAVRCWYWERQVDEAGVFSPVN